MKRVEIAPGEFVNVPDEMIAKARAALERTNKMLGHFDADFPEPECSVCGRVIYCGASTLCNEKPCGLQKS
jgi:hypothetical protein